LVYNKAEDCYKAMAAGSTPPYDVLLTNPPYSGDHMEKLLRFCIGEGRPWLLLLPNFTVTKAWYKELTQGLDSPPVYLCPRKRYNYLPPEGLRRELKTAPFESFWCMSLGKARTAAVDTWSSTNHCRLAFGFKKRRGVPGYVTALDEDGWLIESKDRLAHEGKAQSFSKKKFRADQKS